MDGHLTGPSLWAPTAVFRTFSVEVYFWGPPRQREPGCLPGLFCFFVWGREDFFVFNLRDRIQGITHMRHVIICCTSN